MQNEDQLGVSVNYYYFLYKLFSLLNLRITETQYLWKKLRIKGAISWKMMQFHDTQMPKNVEWNISETVKYSRTSWNKIYETK